ncbi:MAG TPA: hypothetical protein PKD67_02060 [Ignavibacteriaceae bacterium]|nr:hypothetical protein [Ignavibacteriaceae bacterium]
MRNPINKKLSRAKIKISGSSNNPAIELLVKFNLDTEVFNNIKAMQQLPDDVVIKFLQAEFSLSETDYKKRISIEHK